MLGVKRDDKNKHVMSVIKKVLKFLNINRQGYDVDVDIQNEKMTLYRIKFKRPIKMTDDDYYKLIQFLIKLNHGFMFAVIDGQEDDANCNGCYDIKIRIDCDEINGSIYLNGIRFEVRF